MNPRTSPGEFIIQFIKTYKDNPCLWNPAIQDYRDKKKKKAGYKALMDVMKIYHDNVTLEDTKKKINCIRACFRREERKKSKYIMRGKIYKPKLWYYEMLSFLEEVISSNPSFNYLEVSVDETDVDAETDLDQHVATADTDSDNLISSPPQAPELLRKRRRQAPKKTVKLKTNNNTAPHCNEEYIYISQTSCDDDFNSGTQNCEDEFDTIGKCFANKLRRIAKISRERVGIAERIINDVLFEAEFRGISSNTRIVYVHDPPKEES